MTRPTYRVLHVDDSDDDAILFERFLKTINGFSIVWRACDGVEARAYLAGEGEFADRKRFPFPDVMILDIKMPRCDGFEVLEGIPRKAPRPIIAVFSSSNAPEDRERAQRLGADLYQTKIWDGRVFERFMHFVSQIAHIKRPQSP